MTFAVSVPYALLVLFGTALIVAAFNTKRITRWENRALTSLANAVRDIRVNLEEEQSLLQSSPAQAITPAPEAQGPDIDIWAA